MRGLAIILILLFHLEIPYFGWAYVGVDLFFLLSGFLITRLLLAERAETGSINLNHFFGRRLRRLYPTFATTMALTVCSALLLLSPRELIDFGREVFWSNLHLANFYYSTLGDYFDAGSKGRVLLHTWTLSTEEQFYLFWPLAILLIRKNLKLAFVVGIALSFGGRFGYPYYGPYHGDNKPIELVLMGDSHARQYVEGLATVLDHDFFIAAGESCLHLPGWSRVSSEKNWDEVCPTAYEQALKAIQSAETPPLVVISQSWSSQLELGRLLERLDERPRFEDVATGILKLASELPAKKLVVIGNVPRAGTDLFELISRPAFYHFLARTDFERLHFREREGRLVKMNQKLKTLADETGAFLFLDPFDVLCEARGCHNLDEQGRLMYSDESHLSIFGSRFVVERFWRLNAEALDALRESGVQGRARKEAP